MQTGEWISVDDYLPGDSEMVLCYVPLSYNGYRGIHYGWIGPRLNYAGKIVGRVFREHSPHAYAHEMEDAAFTGAMGSKVTHWMRLPNPPLPDDEIFPGTREALDSLVPQTRPASK